MRMMKKSSGYGDRTGSVCLSAGRLRQHGGIPGVFCCKHCGGAYFCGFTNDLATLTFDGEASTISGTDKDGIELFCTENLAGQYAECDVEQKRHGTFLHKNYLKEVFS